MHFDIVTIFPDLLVSPLEEGIIRRARIREQISLRIVNLRDFAFDKHQMTDDRPFGGGEGMLMKPEPLAEAVKFCKKESPLPTEEAKVILLSPQGRRYNQGVVKELAQRRHLILVCGRYEGVDERFIKNYIDDEISLGDFILSGGELGSMVLIDSITRTLPGVLSCRESVTNDTFSRNLLKHPQYTRPRVFEGQEVPEQLLSGDHAQVEKYRFIKSVQQTLEKRPDLLAGEEFSEQELKELKISNLKEKIDTLQKKTAGGKTGEHAG